MSALFRAFARFACVAFVCMAANSGARAQIFDFSFVGSYTITGTFGATGTPGSYTLISGAGSLTDNVHGGSTTITIAAPGTFGNDNQLFFPNTPYFSNVFFGGAGFQGANGNLYRIGSTGDGLRVADSNFGDTNPVSGKVAAAAGSPVPAIGGFTSLLLMMLSRGRMAFRRVRAFAANLLARSAARDAMAST